MRIEPDQIEDWIADWEASRGIEIEMGSLSNSKFGGRHMAWEDFYKFMAEKIAAEAKEQAT